VRYEAGFDPRHHSHRSDQQRARARDMAKLELMRSFSWGPYLWTIPRGPAEPSGEFFR
jgi:hypothetical protein